MDRDRQFSSDRATARVLRAPRDAGDGVGWRGTFRVACFDREGRLRWRDIATNLVTTLGLNAALEIMFRAQSQITLWYVGLVDNTAFSAFNPADTSASHGGWVEFQGYSNSNRLQWSPGPASAGSIANPASMNFNITATGTIRGLFLSQSNVIGAHGTELLYSEAAFSSGLQSVGSGDTLQCSYSLTNTSTSS